MVDAPVEGVPVFALRRFEGATWLDVEWKKFADELSISRSMFALFVYIYVQSHVKT